MTITYEYEGALYVNLTNKCNCNCEFCLRHGRKEGSIYTEDSLWLEREPTRQEALDSFLSRDVCAYREIVFCGYGEPTYRIEDILWLVDQLKERFTAPQLVGRLALAAGLLPEYAPVTPQELLPHFAWDKLPRQDFVFEL